MSYFTTVLYSMSLYYHNTG